MLSRPVRIEKPFAGFDEGTACLSGYVRASFANISPEADVMRELDLDDKLDILMSLAADDREGPPGRDPSVLPPRLRHANDVGALRPLNIRTVRSNGGAGAPKTLLRILMTNACSFNCHY